MAIANEVPIAVRGCLEACTRCELVVDAVSDAQFSGTGRTGHPIGAHLRHALDHMICFMRGLPEGILEYDRRDRDEALETDREQFKKALHAVMKELEEIPKERLGDTVDVRVTASLGTEPLSLEATVERELAFLSSHTLHHLAVVRHLCREEGVDLPEDIAYAFSTAAYRKAKSW